MALIDSEAVALRLGRELSSDEEDAVEALIDSAQAHMEAYVRKGLESAERVETFDPYDRVLLLRHWPVTQLESIEVAGEAVDLSEVKVTPRGHLYRWPRQGWGTTEPLSVVVEYQGGYKEGEHDAELAHLRSICAEMVARAVRLAADYNATPAGAGAVQSVSLSGSDTVTYATGGGSTTTAVPVEAYGRFLSLLDSEKAELNRYRGFGVA